MGLKKAKSLLTDFYSAFDQLNGEHPWMKAVPDGFVPYRVRELDGGRVVYFNFTLAKEMGLIAEHHPNQLNSQLEKKLLTCFAIQIINEYDELNKKRIPLEKIKPGHYMATRYLQLQHPNKRGKTSGDGRGIWNGLVTHKNKFWDVSSRGTGVTCLSPGAVQAKKPLKTGGTEFGYGCGLAEMDELLGCAIMSELMHQQGYRTERVLCVIDLGKGHGIGVRSAPNLLRPAHIFPYLKQNRIEDLKNAIDYFITRQIQNGSWQLGPRNMYFQAAERMAIEFAQFAARLENDYVFAWLDWDGDNVLAHAGIIDYGSVRQFGLRHDEYRYDDVDRWSTNLNEQKNKARKLIQVFVQAVDFVQTKEKKGLASFAAHPILVSYDQELKKELDLGLLFKLGLSELEALWLLKNKPALIAEFKTLFSYFERAKVQGKEILPDGVNRPPLFNMRRLLAHLPQRFNIKKLKLLVSEQEFFDIMLSRNAKNHKIKLGKKHKIKIQDFIRTYEDIIKTLKADFDGPKPVSIKNIEHKARQKNAENRLTGNALIQIVDELVELYNKRNKQQDVQKIIDEIIQTAGNPDQSLVPKVTKSNFDKNNIQVYSKLESLIYEYAEDI